MDNVLDGIEKRTEVIPEFSGKCVLNVEKQGEEILFDGIDNEILDQKVEKDTKYNNGNNKNSNNNNFLKQDMRTVYVEELKQKEFEEKIKKYFDLDRDYKEIKKELAKVDENLKNSIEYGSGIRILNQDLFETIISFIISANNNIPRIKGIIERICKNYGEEIEFRGKTYYSFPTPEELSKASVQDFRNLGLGFRDVRVYNTTQKIAKGEFNIEKLYGLSTEDAANELLTLDGVGPKVCDCILLFSDLKRFDVFPIDVWVRRVMNELYIHEEDEKKVNKKDIKKLADEKFGSLEGIAQQYLFYWKREA